MALVFARDASGRLRYFEWQGGSDDHAERHQYFYDAAGRQRFAFLTFGAVNGTEYEERVYFADNGSVERRRKRLVKGPGYAIEPETGMPDPHTWVRHVCP
jgi:hypothetical protein